MGGLCHSFRFMKSFKTLSQEIYSCTECTRLIKHCKKIAETKRRAFQDQTYWGKPIAPFGDSTAELLIVGLAPAAHGGNRTGRIFTGDESGNWLYEALHVFGFANQAESVSRDDGLKLKNTIITCAVKCAPPDNKPTTEEIARCTTSFLKPELILYSRTRVVIALGRLAYEQFWKGAEISGKRPEFKHGAEILLPNGKTLLLSFHPSQQNTYTKRLTRPMFHGVFQRAKELLEG